MVLSTPPQQLTTWGVWIRDTRLLSRQCEVQGGCLGVDGFCQEHSSAVTLAYCLLPPSGCSSRPVGSRATGRMESDVKGGLEALFSMLNLHSN